MPADVYAIKSVEETEVRISKAYLDVEKQHTIEAEKYCKVCGREGKRVLPVTMATHLDVKQWPRISDGFLFSFTLRMPGNLLQ